MVPAPISSTFPRGLSSTLNALDTCVISRRPVLGGRSISVSYELYI
jgi:hypothetical protein